MDPDVQQVIDQVASTEPDFTGIIASIVLLTSVLIAKFVITYFWSDNSPRLRRNELVEENNELLKKIWRQLDPTRNDNIHADVTKLVDDSKD